MDGPVTPRPDGVKARCGGPAICTVCAREAAQKAAASRTHEYLSTSCLHAAELGREDPRRYELHGYCQAATGSNGSTEWAKAPAVCKVCGAACICPCHPQEG